MEEPLLESEHVYKVYSQIADHFSDTRYKPWPNIAQFLLQQPPGSLIADVGCGNGKYLGVNTQTYMLGSDICPELVSIAHSRQYEVVVCDCLNLPYRSNQFDAAICIAVVHHLSTEERRSRALRELTRIVRPGGKMMVYVWAMEQKRRKFSSQDVMVPWHMQPKYTGQPPPSRVRGKKQQKQKKKRREERTSDVHLETDEGVLLGEFHGFCEGANPLPLVDSLQDCDITGDDGDLTNSSFPQSMQTEVLPQAKEGSYTRTEPNCEVLQATQTNNEITASGDDGELTNSSFPQSRQSEPILQSERGSQTRTEPNCEVLQATQTNDEITASGKQCGVSKNTITAQPDVTKMNSTSLMVEQKPVSQPSLQEHGFQTFQRYYHVFRQGELACLFANVPSVRVREEYYDHENWCVLAEKLVE